MGVKLLAHAANLEAADVLLIADDASLADGEWIAGVTLPVLRIESISQLRFEPGRVTYLPLRSGEAVTRAASTKVAGRLALEALAVATDAARSGAIDGIVFAPLNKHSLRLAGMDHEDELRFMQDRFGVSNFVCEFNITGELWTSRVTSHVPIREVAALINEESIGEAVRIIDGALKRAGIAKPRVAVSGLNPHAGDGGSIGMEEIEIIAPAVRRLCEEGLHVTGPWSPDTVFIAARRGDFDAVVAMYHDQGQIAMKLMGFERGVTLHGGLPVPVATSASGSAFDIAGKGVARVEGLQHAFDICARMAARRV
ncbi:MAG: 4-hydroxythreonine-4-phosphate dehydrogenase PdxA [Pseudomonadota bacterium]